MNSITLSEERDEETNYGYCDDHQPHAVRRMFNYKNGMLYDLRWDDAGNLGQVSMSKPGEMFEAGRFLFWTEDNRMHAAVDDRYYSYYAYDHCGERRLKLTGDNKLLDVNANFMATYTILNEQTLYPSAYMVLTNRGYTKHYYAGAERVAARLGGGGLDALDNAIGYNDTLLRKADTLFGQSLEQVNSRALNGNDIDCILGNGFAKEEFGHPIDGIPCQMQAGVDFFHDPFKDMVHSMQFDHNNGQEREVYFYHSDHLGSASWITDSGGQAIQHLQYLPYGEPYINQRTSGYNERYTFTGKEKDEETGYGYFGARYMDHELMTMWLSVDPMADKYPSISPYAYCAWNPVKLVDPDGREVINRHTKKIENLKKEIADLEGQIKDCNGSNLKELEGKLAGKKKSLKEEMKYEKIVDNAIQDLKNYGGDEFGKLDQLTDVNGNKVDVYIQMVDYIDKIGGPEGKTYGDVRSDGPCSSIMGPNTMLISLSHKYRDVAGKVLAHEGGHVLFDVKFPHVLAAFYSLHPSAERNGHDQDNPSGKMANAYENRYEENRRRTIK